MSVCLTSLDHPSFGLSSPGQPCNGHGVCVNASLSLREDERFLCLCDEGWLSNSDVFDLRAENGLAFDCPMPESVYVGIWGLQLAGLIFRHVVVLVAVVVQICDDRKVGKTWKQSLLGRLTTKILLFDLLVGSPILESLPFQKLFVRSAIGTEVGVTLSLVLGTWFGIVAFNAFSHATFKSLTNGSAIDPPNKERLNRMHLRISLLADISYLILTGLPTFASLALDKRAGPIQSNEYIVLLVRNFGIIFFIFMQFLSAKWLELQAKRLLESFENASHVSATEVIQFLRTTSISLQKRSIVIMVFWCTFSVPQLWAYQGFGMSIVTVLATFAANEGWVTLRSRRKMLKRTPPDGIRSKSNAAEPNAIPQSSVYMGTDIAGDAVSSFFRVRKLLVRHDTMVLFLTGNQATAVRLAQLAGHPFCVGFVAVEGITATVVETLVLVGVLPSYVGIISLCMTILTAIPAASALVSLSLLRALFRTPAVLLRFAALILVFGNFLDVLEFDERSAVAVACLFASSFIFIVDSLVEEARTAFLYPIIFLSATVPMRCLVLLQFDLLAQRRETLWSVDLGSGYSVSWSTYQTARDFALIATSMAIADSFHAFLGRGGKYFRHFTGGINVKIVKLDRRDTDDAENQTTTAVDIPAAPDNLVIAQLGLPKQDMRNVTKRHDIWSMRFKAGAVAAAGTDDEHRPAPESGTAQEVELGWLDTIVLREEDSVACRLLGKTKVNSYFGFISQTPVRLASLISQTIPFAIFNALCLTNLVNPNVSFLLLLVIFSLLRSLSLKSTRLIKLLVCRVSFVIEAVPVGIILALLGYLLNDTRALVSVILFLSWLDLRLSDARAVFWHTRTRGGADAETHKAMRTAYIIVGFVLCCSILLLPVLLVLGGMRSTKMDESIQLRKDSKFSTIYLNQLVIELIVVFSISTVADLIADATRRKNSKVMLRHLRAPVLPMFEESQANSGNQEVTTRYATVYGSVYELDRAPADAGQTLVSVYEEHELVDESRS